jgi:PAS domain S-box-containing protein
LPAAIYVCDAEGYITFFNEAAAALWGRTPELQVEQWCGALKIFRPDGTPVALDLCPMALAVKGGWRSPGDELILERPDGTRRNVVAYPDPIRDGSGAVAGAINTVLDVTEYKAAQQALHKSEDRSRRYFELGLIGMATTSPLKGILEVNDEFCRILGYGRSELLQQTWAELTHPDDLAADVAQFNRVMAGEFDGYTLDKRWIRKDGEIIDSVMTANCLRRADGSVDYFVGLIQDITERKRNEERLRESEKRFRVLVESIPHHVWSFSSDGVLGYWNQRLMDYTGLSAGQLKQGGWEALHPDDVAGVREALRKARAEGTQYDMEHRVRGRDGRYRRFVSRAEPVPDAHGRVVEWFGTNTDVEDRRQAEEELHKAQSELAHVMRLTTIGELGATVAHEVNQPLGAIVNNASVALRLAGAETAATREELRDVLSEIVSDANRASAIIARVREVMKRDRPGMEPLQIEAIAREVLAFAAREIARHQITVRTEIPNELPSVWGDRVQLQQVLFNLVMNGIEAMSAVEIPRRVLTIGGRSATLNGQPAVEITVHDLGCGFGVEDLERVFESFYTTKPDGLGMGLRISRSIVEAHGGRLWVQANEDEGATLSCSLPVML